MTTKLVATPRGRRVLNVAYFIAASAGTAGIIILSGILESL